MSGLCLRHGWWHHQELPVPVGERRRRAPEPPFRRLEQENETGTEQGEISQRRGRGTSPGHSKDLEKEQTALAFDFSQCHYFLKDL